MFCRKKSQGFHLDVKSLEESPYFNKVVATQIFFMFTPKIEEDEPILTHIFQVGWFNHHLVLCQAGGHRYGDLMWRYEYSCGSPNKKECPSMTSSRHFR